MATDFALVDDIETLRDVARQQAAEIARLRDELVRLARQLAEAQGKDGQSAAQLKLAAVEAQLARLQQQRFGDSSEKREAPASDVAAKDDGSEPAKPARRGHGPRPQPKLPVQERLHAFDDAARTCPTCTGTLEAMGEQTEDSEEVSLVERQYIVVRHRRQKYRCRCNAAVVTTPGPKKLIPGGRYSVDFAIDVAVAKYADHLPLERQAHILDRYGVVVETQTLWDQIEALARWLKPTYDALGARARGSEIVHADETWWRLMDRKASARWWAWCLASPDSVHYRILPSRGADAAKVLFGEFAGIALTDGYGAYSALSRAGPRFVLANCWAHARRKFWEIEEHYPDESRRALEWIGELYAVERELPEWVGLAGDDRAAALAERQRLRDTRSRPVIESLRDWAYAQKGLRESGLRKAVEYMLGLWPGLTRFLDDPRVPIDNNPVERAIRGSVVGRKNHYGSRSVRGTEVAALFYSLLETASLCGEDEKAYLTRATYAALDGHIALPNRVIK